MTYVLPFSVQVEVTKGLGRNNNNANKIGKRTQKPAAMTVLGGEEKTHALGSVTSTISASSLICMKENKSGLVSEATRSLHLFHLR